MNNQEWCVCIPVAILKTKKQKKQTHTIFIFHAIHIPMKKEWDKKLTEKNHKKTDA